MKTSKCFSALFAAIVVSLMVFQSCHNPMGQQQVKESPTAGNISICVDESFKLLFDTQVYTFETLYLDAKITPIYKPEADVLDAFLKDSVQTVVLTKDLSQEQRDKLLQDHFVVKTTKIAQDALALIINPGNNDSLMLVDQLAGLFRGKITSWKQINPKSDGSDISVVFDNNKSGNVRYFREKFDLKGDFPANFFAVNSNEEVLKYVEKNRNALGIISVNWISDRNDSVSNRFLKSVRVVEVGTDPQSYYRPYQAYIADGSYPLCREVFMLNRETFTGLGTGFVNFVAGDQGQRMVLRSGLVPSTMPIRLIKINKD